MALWPFTDAYFLSGQEWFPTVCREYWLTNCWLDNIRGALWELILLGPVAAVALYTRKFDQEQLLVVLSRLVCNLSVR